MTQVRTEYIMTDESQTTAPSLMDEKLAWKSEYRSGGNKTRF